MIVLWTQDESVREEGEENGSGSAQDSEEERAKVARSWLEAEETDTSDEEVCEDVDRGVGVQM